MSEPFNVLVSSAGRRVSLVKLFRTSLRELDLPGEVIATDMSRLAAAFHAADDAVQVPPCGTDEFVPALLAVCEARSVRLLVPTIDTELPALAASRDRFAAVGTTVAVSDPGTVAIGADKELTHTWLEAQGFGTVPQTTVARALADPHRWPLPLVVKPRRGSAGIGVGIVRARAELEFATRRTDVVVETVAPGVEHTIDVLVDRCGRVVCGVPRRRLEVRAGEVSKGVTVRAPAVEKLALHVCETLPGAYGAITVQMFVDEDGSRPCVIEINPRFGGGFPLTWAAGAPFPRWMLEEIAGLPSTACHDGWREGLVMLRYDEAVFVDAGDAGL